ncbi:hypothetical protein DICVIV_11527 [Dictyocaulus viviparus]|uniref:Uncharacterized protein n=1 Tax=Dictyocaulus viviparus TaxID=29172 RepID=A0A0D8XFI8_DICVI|nr:hypothetical protein DICVIV_11527 [Dictyocaulus viviparus]
MIDEAEDVEGGQQKELYIFAEHAYLPKDRSTTIQSKEEHITVRDALTQNYRVYRKIKDEHYLDQPHCEDAPLAIRHPFVLMENCLHNELKGSVSCPDYSSSKSPNPLILMISLCGGLSYRSATQCTHTLCENYWQYYWQFPQWLKLFKGQWAMDISIISESLKHLKPYSAPAKQIEVVIITHYKNTGSLTSMYKPLPLSHNEIATNASRASTMRLRQHKIIQKYLRQYAKPPRSSLEVML